MKSSPLQTLGVVVEMDEAGDIFFAGFDEKTSFDTMFDEKNAIQMGCFDFHRNVFVGFRNDRNFWEVKKVVG